MTTCTRCGAKDVHWWTAYNRTARPRLENADGSAHECPANESEDIIECLCGVVVFRYGDGTKRNFDDGEPHVCARPVTVTIAPPVTKQPARPVNTSGGWKGIVSTEIHRGV